MVTSNPAPRVASCEVCGAQVPAGARGPLPRRCAGCRDTGRRDVAYRIASAINAATRAGASARVTGPLTTALRRAQDWTSYGE